MKLLLLPLLLVTASAGWYGLSASPADASETCTTDDCRITVECTDRDTCLVTCYDENDAIVCQEEVPCDGPCDKVCDEPCEAPAPSACDKPCAPSSCSR
jgi:hypothetical protein